MNNGKKVIGTTIALLAVLGMSAGWASAGSQDYSVPGGTMLTYTIGGSNPSLVENVGDAEISDVRFVGNGEYEVDVECLDALPVVCTGQIVW